MSIPKSNIKYQKILKSIKGTKKHFPKVLKSTQQIIHKYPNKKQKHLCIYPQYSSQNTPKYLKKIPPIYPVIPKKTPKIPPNTSTVLQKYPTNILKEP